LTIAKSHRFRIVLAFASVYIIWGSTYLFIKYAIDTIPPFFMAGLRNGIAGLILFTFARLRGDVVPSWVHWRSALFIGALMLLGGNGGVTWSEQYVPSGLTALLVATVPIWMVVLNWFTGDRVRPGIRDVLSVGMGMVGLFILVGPEELIGGGRVHALGAAVLVVAALSWASGSLYSRRAELPPSPVLSTGMQMLMGGLCLMVVGVSSGEHHRLDVSGISTSSFVSLVYLILFGSLVGFSAYVWLLKQTTPSRVATYAYVNPVVAVFLGWLVDREPLTVRTLLSAAVIVAAVVIVTLPKNSAQQSWSWIRKAAVKGAGALKAIL
jgi:drug/metabolite transporter (DMT)-like permease